MLNENPVNATSRTDLMLYLCNLHNNVNMRLNKPEFNCKEDLQKTYGGDCGCEETDSAIHGTNITNGTDNGTR